MKKDRKGVINRLKGLKLLIVDDDEQHAVLFGMLLESICGASVTVARDYNEGLAVIRNQDFDAMLIDYRLSYEGNGVDLLRIIIEEKEVGFLVLMSATSRFHFKPDEQEWLDEHEEIVYFEKPFVFPTIVYQITDLLADRANGKQ
ncbi:MAG: response regulator [Anaerolineae bacterium]|nr:response regulator [Anaerolineae bacterium]